MSHNWCHGPLCHTISTQDRERGSSGSKVLRTRKVKQTQWNENSFYRFFCSNGCYNDFANKNAEQIIRIAPRTEPLETPCEVKTETRTGWDDKEYSYKVIDKLSNIG